jgi:N-acetylated-alpha-linked acidic dipeptidase
MKAQGAAVALALVASPILLAVVGSSATPPALALTGYGPKAAARERELETVFRAIPSPERARAWHRYFTAEPHPAGSERNDALARYVADEWRKQGLEDVTVHRYDVLNTAPREVSLVMTAPVRYVASLREEPYEADPDTKNAAVSPAYLGLSASVDVEAPVVYANNGNPDDYALLRRNGIEPRGKLALVRYSRPYGDPGYSYRGFKALTAEREGAAGILVFSDPDTDGFGRGPVFPEGPWGPESHLQRGAITYDFIVPGDPLTPGWPSRPGARRLKPEESRSLPKIGGLPLSWKDAKPLLENLDGPVAPREWQGGLPLEYRLGGERVLVHLKVAMDNRVAPNYVVEGRVRGGELPDEWIVLGNHRDAWVFGGVDPSSGTASLMEVTRAAGEILRSGRRPRRTLVFCSWDGEEVGLTGSTEWGEDLADELGKKAVAYLNVDYSAAGPHFAPQAIASLAPLVRDLAREFSDPATGLTLLDALRADNTPPNGPAADDASLVNVRLGSGSDQTVFLNHLGIPAVDLSFGGPYGVYHSMYDDFFWVNRFADPGYRYQTLMARYWGTLALRLAGADVLPFDLEAYARHLRGFVDALAAEVGGGRLDLAGLRSRVDAFEAAGRRLNEARGRALASGLDPALAGRVNRGLIDLERNWLDPEGLPGRPWFKHTLYASRYTYAHLELPGLTEAAEENDWARATRQAVIVERALDRNVALVEDLARQLGAAGAAR